jgi:hypothetical protein
MAGTKVHAIGWYVRYLDTSQYATKRDLMNAARQLRDADVARRRDERDFDQWLRGRQFHSAGERRHAVRRGTHRWCSGMFGFGGCHNTGVIQGRGGVQMKCGRCGGEGVIRNRGKTRRSKARGKAWRP